MELKTALGKHAKLIITIVVCVVVIIIAVALIAFLGGKPVSDNTNRGNTINNIVNGGHVVTADDGTVYFVRKQLFRLDKDGHCEQLTDLEMPSPDKTAVTSLCYYEGYIYFSNHAESQEIYRINLETKELQKVSSIAGGGINIVDGTLYYAALRGYTTVGIYKIDLQKYEEDTKYEPELITVDRTDYVVYYNDRLYFINHSDYNKVYSMKVDGSDRAISANRTTSMFTFEDGYLYYASSVYGVFRCNPDGSNRVQISDMRASNILVADGYAYHCLLSGDKSDAGQEFYRADLKTQKSEMISKDSAQYLGLADGYVYFNNVYKSYEVYRVSLDNKIFENVAAKYGIN